MVDIQNDSERILSSSCTGICWKHQPSCAKQIANQHQITQPTDQSTTYLQQLQSELPRPTPVSGKQLLRDKAVGTYRTLGDMPTLNSPTLIAGNIASDSHSLPLNKIQSPLNLNIRLL